MDGQYGALANPQHFQVMSPNEQALVAGANEVIQGMVVDEGGPNFQMASIQNNTMIQIENALVLPSARGDPQLADLPSLSHFAQVYQQNIA